MTNKPERAGSRACWFLGAPYGLDDQTSRFLNDGIWENGYQNKYLDQVKSIQTGDRNLIDLSEDSHLRGNLKLKTDGGYEMIVKCGGGMTEFIPSPQKKWEGLVWDHSFNLIENLHHRLRRLGKELRLPLDEAGAYSAFLDKMKQDEFLNKEIHTSLITVGHVVALIMWLRHRIPESIQPLNTKKCPGKPLNFRGISFVASITSSKAVYTFPVGTGPARNSAKLG